MQERVAIVTGASGGIGLEVARGLLARGDDVVLAVRDVERGAQAARQIGGGEPMRLDLADHASVRTFADAFRARFGRLDVLVNNAGIHTARHELSVDGIERTLATNHVGHFLLTHLLLDVLKESTPSRVVNVASEAHRFGRVHWEDLNAPRGIAAYTQSKIASIMFTYALARRLEGTGVSVFAVHPGSVRTRWARGSESGLFRFGAALASPFLLTPEEGARTPLYAATSPALDGKTGLYLVRRRVSEPIRLARDVAAQERLWRASEEMAGLRATG